MQSDQLVSGNSSKAGLPSSLTEINSRISEASKDSRFTAAQDRKAAELEVKIEKQREVLQKALEKRGLVRRAAKMVDDLMEEFQRDQKGEFEKWREFCWVCVDMDAFYASVECLDAPELKNVPMAVGSSAMLSTANYEARKYGVSAALPGYIALKLCPELKIMPLRFERYKEMSGRVGEILKKYDGNMMMWSLDEAFLKLKRVEGVEFVDLVSCMRNEVKEKTGLTCSAGIAANPLLSKLASNFRKPDGQFEINRESIEEMRSFLHPQPVIKLSGIGKVMSVTLEKVLGIRTVGDLYEKRHLLPLIFKEKTVNSLLCKSIGHSEGDTPDLGAGDDDSGQKSVSCERTFGADEERSYEEIFEEISENLSQDLREMKVVEVGRVGIKVKTFDFRVFTRERSVSISVSVESEDLKRVIFRTASALYKDFKAEKGDCDDGSSGGEVELRLIGIRLGSLKWQQKKKRRANLMEKWLGATDEDNQSKCPICYKPFQDANDLAGINEHVDECLTKSMLKEILEKEK